MQDAATFWNKAAEKYAKSPIKDMESYNYTLGRTRSYMSPNDRVLELGCGTGSTALLLAADVRHLTASDVSPTMIQIAKRKADAQGITNVTFLAGDVTDATAAPGPYDVVMAFNILHLVTDLPAAVRHAHSLLKPGGLFISKTFCKPDHGGGMKFRAIRTMLPLMQALGKAPYVNFMTIAELEATVTSQGFAIVETGNYPASPPSRYIVARKS